MIKGLIIECDNKDCKKEFIERREYDIVAKLKKHYCQKCRRLEFTGSPIPEIEINNLSDEINKKIIYDSKLRSGGIVIKDPDLTILI